MEREIYTNVLIPQMLLKETTRHNIYLYGEVTEASIFETIYYLDKVIRLYDAEETPIEKREINLFIDSYGGEVYEILSLCSRLETLRNQGYKINTYCYKAMSAGFIAFLMGDNRYVYKYSTLMYHSVSSGTFGKIQTQVENIKETNRLNNILKEITLEKTKIPKEKIDEVNVRKQDWFMDSKEAIELGVANKML